MERWSDMAIGVERERDRAVTEELLHHLGVHATAEEVRGCSVSEVMDPNSRQTCLIERSVKPFGHPGSIGRSSNGRREYQACVVPLGPATSWSSTCRRRCSDKALSVPVAR
jgi:hypothetical protein